MRARTAGVTVVLLGIASIAAGQPPPPTVTVRPPEATACHSDAECVVAPLDDESREGLCCPPCGQYEALNRTWAAHRPKCDEATRGACPRSCVTSNGPPAVTVCASQRCFLSYPATKNTCDTDYDCTALPALSSSVAANGCRIACGEYTLASRASASAVRSLYRDPHASGTCPDGCADPVPDLACQSHVCTPVEATAFRVRAATATAPTITGPVSTVDVQSVVYRNIGQFASCEEPPRRLRPTTAFTFELSFTIDALGHVATVDTGQISSKIPDIAACIEKRTRAWQFARPLGGRHVEVRYPVQLAVDAR